MTGYYEFTECAEARMWESSGFNVCANNNLLLEARWIGRQKKTLRQVAFGVDFISMQILSDTSFKLQRIGFLGGQASLG